MEKQDRLMNELAGQLGSALKRSELIQNTEAAADRLRAATEAAFELGRSLEPGRVIESMLRRAAEEANADLVVLLRREDNHLVTQASFDRAGQESGARYRISLAADWPSRRALELGQPVVRSLEPPAVVAGDVHRLRDLKHTARVPILRASDFDSAPHDTRSLGFAGTTVAGTLEGALLLLGRREGAPFTPSDVALLEVLARYAAVAIRNARLYERAQSTARRFQVGVDLALDAVTRLEPEEVIDRILRRTLDAVQAERVTLGRVDDGLRCTILGSVDRSDDTPRVGTVVSIERQQAALEAVRTGRPAQGPIHHEGHVRHYYDWTVVIPLVLGGELVALLGVSGNRSNYSEDEVALMQQIGAVAALALRNATLFQSLKDSNRLRGQFLNMAAHELRTPLSVIAGYVSMLADGSLGRPPPSWEAPLSVLVAKTRELAHLVDDVLLAGRLETDMARTSRRVLDLGEVVTAAIQRLRARVSLMDAKLEVELDAQPIPANCDADQIGRILDNLLNNALSYSSRPAHVFVSVAPEEGWAVVRVEDRGRGIPAEKRERIFEQFYRVDDPGTGYPPGTGLGLFISRGLAERHGGQLQLEWTEVGVGSRFALRLPLA